MIRYEGTFVETQAILAAQAEDVEEVDRLLNTMLPNELFQLSRAASWLAYEAGQVGAAKQRIAKRHEEDNDGQAAG